MEILTGNELMSGATVYLASTGEWIEELQQARLFGKDEAEAREACIAATRQTMRINSVEIETVSLRDGTIIPDRIRERIRAEGRRRQGSNASTSIRTAMYRYDEFDAAFVRERTAQLTK